MVDFDQFAMRRRVQRRGAADQNHLGTAALRGLGQRVAHLAAGAIAEEAHRVEGLARAAGGDQHDFAGQVVATAQRAEHGVGDDFRLGHAARAHHAAGQLARARLNDAHAALAQDFKIGLRAGCSHILTFMAGATSTGASVARYMVVRKSSAMPWANLARMLAVAGATTRASAHCASAMCSMPFCSVCAWSASQLVPQAGDDLVAGQSGKSERLHELAGCFGHDDMHFKGLALQGAHQFGRLVGGNPAGDSHRDSHGWIVDVFDCGKDTWNDGSVVCAWFPIHPQKGGKLAHKALKPG